MYIIAVVIALFHIYVNAFSPLDPLLFRSTALSMAFILAFFQFFSKEKNLCLRLILILFIIASVSSWLYMLFQYNDIIYRSGVIPNTYDIIFGTITIVLIFEVTRRTIGYSLFIFGIIIFLYPIFGANLPGILSHVGYSFNREISFLYGLDGIYGSTFSVIPTYLMVFLIFSGFLQVTGAGQFVIKLALALTGKVRGGPAKVAIIASSFFGTINGSTIANVIGTGTFTIPMMKKVGYKPHFAAAVEAAASSGGQIMPPVMGVAAFVMIELSGIPYVDIMKATLIPAILYYIGIFWMVDLRAAKENLSNIEEDIPSIKEVLTSGWHLMIPIVVLLFSLIYFKFSPIRSGLLASASCIPASWIKKETRIDIKKFFDALEIGGRGIVTVAGPCAIAGVIVGVFSLTGAGVKLGISLLSFSHENPFIALTFTAIFAIILGMGQPSVSAYIIVAAIAVPNIIQLGIPILSAHLFAFYFATFSNVTPPVAVASYVAAGIANANPLKTAFCGFKLSIAAFIVPFLFIVQPGLLLSGSILSIFQAIVSALIGIIALGSFIEGWLSNRLNILERLILLAIAIFTFIPGWTTDIIGIIVFIEIYIKKLKLKRNRLV